MNKRKRGEDENDCQIKRMKKNGPEEKLVVPECGSAQSGKRRGGYKQDQGVVKQPIIETKPKEGMLMRWLQKTKTPVIECGPAESSTEELSKIEPKCEVSNIECSPAKEAGTGAEFGLAGLKDGLAECGTAECGTEKFSKIEQKCEVSHVECGPAEEAGTGPELGLTGQSSGLADYDMAECGNEKFNKKEQECEKNHAEYGPAEQARYGHEVGLAGVMNSDECDFTDKFPTEHDYEPECGSADDMHAKELTRFGHDLAEKTGSGTECGMTDKSQGKEVRNFECGSAGTSQKCGTSNDRQNSKPSKAEFGPAEVPGNGCESSLRSSQCDPAKEPGNGQIGSLVNGGQEGSSGGRKRKMTGQPSIQPRRRRRKEGVGGNMWVESLVYEVIEKATIGAESRKKEERKENKYSNEEEMMNYWLNSHVGKKNDVKPGPLNKTKQEINLKKEKPSKRKNSSSSSKVKVRQVPGAKMGRNVKKITSFFESLPLLSWAGVEQIGTTGGEVGGGEVRSGLQKGVGASTADSSGGLTGSVRRIERDERRECGGTVNLLQCFEAKSEDYSCQKPNESSFLKNDQLSL